MHLWPRNKRGSGQARVPKPILKMSLVALGPLTGSSCKACPLSTDTLGTDPMPYVITGVIQSISQEQWLMAGMSHPGEMSPPGLGQEARPPKKPERTSPRGRRKSRLKVEMNGKIHSTSNDSQ